ncbi:hypothetical protein ACD575_03480 [Campylobacter sp. LH-2024]|uniref:Uncharacterized protein n=1 Tax=Campylobacter molothri TaxID=1032242 RepID=A0ACC5W0R0_9BACT|nr:MULTISPECIES: hypothetical protein [unclassified Campylobacter]MBZ7928061.1 hypothetical protein [Campylobacter sp. RM10542]MBZ7929714.1 hypothetical protein [Campylobacter sp. W0067]MBZ7930814.1 hypothetical protein [Campylobacter sp. RM12910]MBZ7933444.1 hypothetical protein [Campylobacter sp. RM10543]MBZ7934732.1 hypothetical protein [Campylobacter sp. W0065]MBZ7936889.1 hypothetical protein [Campylobacter sp. RM10538]MBZ7940088.1 hypothetical protein [Campylobacter sp. W0047]MBZ79422
MSKPLNEEFFIPLNLDLVDKKNEVLLQVLDLLEVLKSNKDEKMVRISSELSEILENEENFEKIAQAKNLDELLEILVFLNDNKMIKIYENSYLEEKFPNLAADKFLK